MFTVYNSKKEIVGKFSDFNLAKSQGFDTHVVDENGYTYFKDGTGLGYSAFKQENNYQGSTIYNQKERTAGQIKSVSWQIFWKLGLKEVKKYHIKVRALIKQNKLKVLPE